LYPRPDNLGGGAVQVGWRGDSYVSESPDNFQPPGAGGGDVLVTGGPNGSSVGVLGVPTTFSKPSGDQG
jgi:hypothetical protein